MNKFLNYITSELLLSLVFLNYIFYFILDTKFFFSYFSFIILLVFSIILINNVKINFYIVLVVVILSFISLGSPVADWDSRSIWLFNAKRIFYNLTLKEFSSYYGSEFSPVDYPILVQTLSASLATLIGHWNEVFPKFSNVIMALPALFIFTNVIKSNLTKLFLFILIFFIYEKRLINGDMDALLSLYACASLILLIEYSNLKELNIKHITKLFLYLMTLTMIKIEGIGILACLLFSYIFINYKDNFKVNYKIVLTFLVSLIPIILWKFYILDKNVVSSSSLMISGGERFLENLLNFKFMIALFKGIFLNKQMFIAIIIFILSISKYISLNKKTIQISLNKILLKKRLLFTIITLSTYFILLLLIFISSEGSFKNVQEIQFAMAKTAADRLFLPVHSMLILSAIYLNEEKKSNYEDKLKKN